MKFYLNHQMKTRNRSKILLRAPLLRQMKRPKLEEVLLLILVGMTGIIMTKINRNWCYKRVRLGQNLHTIKLVN